MGQAVEQSLDTVQPRNALKYSLATFRRKSPFMASVREKARILRLSIRTEEAYAHWISAFLCWSGWKTPETLTTDDVTRYLSSLATERHVSASTQNQARRALLLFLPCTSYHQKMKSLLTLAQLEVALQSLPAKYHSALTGNTPARDSAKRGKYHYNSLLLSANNAAINASGKAVGVGGFRRTLLLRDFAAGWTWKMLVKHYGDQMVKTACADLVRQSGPKIVIDNLAG